MHFSAKKGNSASSAVIDYFVRSVTIARRRKDNNFVVAIYLLIIIIAAVIIVYGIDSFSMHNRNNAD